MKLLFVCKASTEIGLGHLMRSRALVETARKGHDVRLVVVGSEIARKLLAGADYPFTIVPSEEAVREAAKDERDVVIFDLVSLAPDLFSHLQERSTLSVSISPIFDRMDRVDLLFNRTRYAPDHYSAFKAKQYLGVEYTIIQPACARIATARFRRNLLRNSFPVAISMGGGDAANKTLLFLESLSKCNVPATFWVLLGEGYQHSYDALMKATERDRRHEIILAKTSLSMWHVLGNCVLAVLPSGITTYEAAYAGLPTINMFDTEDQFFLVRELVEAGVGIYAGTINRANMEGLNRKIEELYARREELLEMHKRSRRLIDGRGRERILSVIEKELKARTRE